MSGSWACDVVAHTIEGSTLGNSLIRVYPSYHYWFAPCTNTALIVDHYWFEAPLNSDASNDLRKYSGLHHRITSSPSYFFSPRLTKSWYLCLGHRPKGSELDSTSAGSRSPYINMNSDSIVIIPTYNERENIAQMIDTVLALPQPYPHQYQQPPPTPPPATPAPAHPYSADSPTSSTTPSTHQLPHQPTNPTTTA